MRTLDKIIGKWLWKPAGFVPSLDALEESHGVAAKWDVTAAVTGSKEGNPLAVVELAGGKIIGDLRMVATGDDIVIGGMQSLPPGVDPANHYLARRRRFRMPKFRRGTALLLGAANSDNYYHWMVDSVPRWKMFEAANRLNYDFVLLHPKPSRFQEEVLDRLNVPKAKRLRCAKYFVHQFERLVVPSIPFPPEQIAPWSCSYLRSLFPETSSGPEKIYLRRGAGRRRLANEAELEAALAEIGFVAIDPQRLTVFEQVKHLSAAQFVVAPHGAALTNMIFAPPGGLMLELFHPHHKNNCYVNIAATCGLHYEGLDGEPLGGSERQMLEYSIDILGVLETLRRAGQMTASKRT